ncbi:hypothetical protein DPMN_125347 [Dreissena polymorpha]|uniref:Uncharacterized protein n=2 Tax=Dreissena polymorpha TaxID=45954 RepID=A0A9D4GUZ2_DREPO|nr:hypothetical protein DPMN_125347 [Dreissena polymorpha]
MTELQVITEEEAVKNNDEEKTDAIPGINKERPLFMPNKNGFMTFPVPNPDEVIIGTTRAIPAEKDDHPGDNKGPSSCDNLEFGSCDKTSISFDSKEISHSDIKEPSSFDNIKSRSCDREKLQRHQSHEDHSKHMKSCNDKSTQGPKELTKKKSRRRKSKHDKYLEHRQVEQDETRMFRKANISEEQQVDILGEKEPNLNQTGSQLEILKAGQNSMNTKEQRCGLEYNIGAKEATSQGSHEVLSSEKQSSDLKGAVADNARLTYKTGRQKTLNIDQKQKHYARYSTPKVSMWSLVAFAHNILRKNAAVAILLIVFNLPHAYACTPTMKDQVAIVGDNAISCFQVPPRKDCSFHVNNDTCGTFSTMPGYDNQNNVGVDPNCTMKLAPHYKHGNFCLTLFNVSSGDKNISITYTGPNQSGCYGLLKVLKNPPDNLPYTCTPTIRDQVATVGDNVTSCFQVPLRENCSVHVNNDTCGSFNTMPGFDNQNHVKIYPNCTYKIAPHYKHVNFCLTLFNVSAGDKNISITYKGSDQSGCYGLLKVLNNPPDNNDKSNNLLWIILGLFIVVVAVVVFLILFVRRILKNRSYDVPDNGLEFREVQRPLMNGDSLPQTQVST